MTGHRARLPTSIVTIAPKPSLSMRDASSKIGVAGKSGIIDAHDAAVGLEPACQLERVVARPLKPQAERRQAAQRQPALERVAGLAQRRGDDPRLLDQARGCPRRPRASDRCGRRSSWSPSARPGWRRARSAGRSAGANVLSTTSGMPARRATDASESRSATRSSGFEIVSAKISRVAASRAT